MSTEYTPEQRAEALALYESGASATQVERQLGIPRPTLYLWREQQAAYEAGLLDSGAKSVNGDSENARTAAAEKKAALAAEWYALQRLHIDRARETVHEASHRDVMIGAGISADKHLDITEGRKGANVQVGDNRSITIVRNTPSLRSRDQAALPEPEDAP